MRKTIPQILLYYLMPRKMAILPPGTLVQVSIPLITAGRILRLNKHGMYEVEVPNIGTIHVTKKDLRIL